MIIGPVRSTYVYAVGTLSGWCDSVPRSDHVARRFHAKRTYVVAYQADQPLAACLALPKLFEGTTDWGGRFPLRVAGYLSTELPPLAYVTSVRAILLRADRVLLLRNSDGAHILPGGRREVDETVEATLRREILEESGWAIAQPTLLGLLYFHHLSPKPAEYPYPHPDFLQLVYVAEAASFVERVPLPDEYERDARFVPIAELNAMSHAPEGLQFLPYALRARVVREHPAHGT
jgi:ADP-ribose pyrophosphatase YjhB (NUDIX family)